MRSFRGKGGVIGKPSAARREKQRQNRRLKIVTELHPNGTDHITRVVEFSEQSEKARREVDFKLASLSRSITERYWRVWLFGGETLTSKQASEIVDKHARSGEATETARGVISRFLEGE